MKKKVFYFLLIALGIITAFGIIMSFKATFAIVEKTGYMQCIPEKTPKNLCEDLVFYKKFVFAAAPTFVLMKLFRKTILKYLENSQTKV